jgi:phosphoribosylanthranilate isomerase
MTRIKVCGITNWEDALAAVELGADAIGFVFAPSPRRIEQTQARLIVERLPPFIGTAAIFVDEDVEAVKETMQATCCTVAQLHGSEPPRTLEALRPWRVVKAIRVRRSEDMQIMTQYPTASGFVLDTYVEGKPGGTGRTFDWSIVGPAQNYHRPIILAGGLTPENVAAALATVRPYGVDASSGVEASPGKKDHEKVARFIQIVRAFDALLAQAARAGEAA